MWFDPRFPNGLRHSALGLTEVSHIDPNPKCIFEYTSLDLAMEFGRISTLTQLPKG